MERDVAGLGLSHYLQRFAKNADANSVEHRLYICPHAGGSPAAYRSWMLKLAPQIDSVAIFLPGRWQRLAEPPFTTMDPLASKVAEEIAKDLAGYRGPFSLFGHSLGALIAFEVARRLEALRATATHLVLSSRKAPERDRVSDLTPVSHLDDDGLVRALDQRYGGIPPALLNSPELLALFATALRHDMQVFESYVWHGSSPLACQTHVWCGSDERMMSESDLPAWEPVVGTPVHTQVLPGGHFYFADHETAFLTALKEVLTPASR